MATFQITAVRTEKSPGGTHEHISHVGIGAAQVVISRSTVIRDLRDPNGDRYYTHVKGARADVIVVDCPRCDFKDYIRTTADSTTADNLLSLPPC
jgi:hypothetical protein